MSAYCQSNHVVLFDVPPLVLCREKVVCKVSVSHRVVVNTSVERRLFYSVSWCPSFPCQSLKLFVLLVNSVICQFSGLSPTTALFRTSLTQTTVRYQHRICYYQTLILHKKTALTTQVNCKFSSLGNRDISNIKVLRHQRT